MKAACLSGTVRQLKAGVATAVFAWMLVSVAHAEILHQETFETDGDGERYDLFDPGFEFTGDSGPGIWGLNFDAEQIGLQQNAPARRAAILWNHEMFPEVPAPESLEVWVSLTEWAVDNKEGAKIGFFPGYEFTEGSLIVAEALENAGYNLEEVLDPADVPTDLDVLIHSSESASTAFAELKTPIISYSSSDHDDTAIAGIGSAHDFLDPVELMVPVEHEGHPALGGKTGMIPWTAEEATLRGIGKLHNGGKAIAFAEDPLTGDDTPAIFVIEEGDPLLGAFNPDPQGDGYLVGAALNKFGTGGERTVDIGPIDIAGKSDLALTVDLAATAADFESGDYLRIEADIDGETVVLDEFWGVDDPGSDCLKGLSNGDFPGEEGDICLPETDFEEFTFAVPSGNEVTLRFALLSTWGNEVTAIDNIRLHSGPLAANPDFNGNGELDAGDLDELTAGMAANDLAYDLTEDGVTDYQDRVSWVRDSKGTWIGDSNLDGVFTSSDFVLVFTAGKFETGDEASWSEGDWDGDKFFSSSDFVAAFIDGGFEAGERNAVSVVPEPSSILMIFVGMAWLYGRMRRR